MPDTRWARDVAVIGGCGHVGLPLAVAFADRGLQVAVYDTDTAAVSQVAAGRMPFREAGAEEALRRALTAGRLTLSADPAVIEGAEHVIVAIGAAEGKLDPFTALAGCRSRLLPGGQLLVLRSTVAPGTTERFAHLWAMDVACCPERIAEGRAMGELPRLPQIIGGVTPGAAQRAEKLFRQLTHRIIHVRPPEAELAKLFTNAWRYLKFAAANQFFQIASDAGLDFEQIRRAVTQDYPRAADLPPAGFTAGPCLPKDTKMLTAYAGGGRTFWLGLVAVAVNKGMPAYVAARAAKRYGLNRMTVGILGTAFKAGSDDPRSSLAAELQRQLETAGCAVVRTDPYVKDDTLLPLATVLELADLLIIGAPHPQYADTETTKPVIDIWGLRGQGTLI